LRLVKSLKKPRGNVTGCANMQTDQAVMDKRINAMLTKMHPKMVGVVGKDNPKVCPIDSTVTLALSRYRTRVCWPFQSGCDVSFPFFLAKRYQKISR
jgi:hypothetical protein